MSIALHHNKMMTVALLLTMCPKSIARSNCFFRQKSLSHIGYQRPASVKMLLMISAPLSQFYL